MAKEKENSISFAERMDIVQRQFKNLDPKDPSNWPTVPRMALFLLIVVAVAFVAWFVFLKDYETELDGERSKEATARDEFQKNLVKAVNLESLKKQREQIQHYVVQLEKQLPNKAEMADLVSDITKSGASRNLKFDLFKPGQVAVKDYYAELPIAIRVTGKYHDIGAFASDVAHLSRIVTLNNISITPVNDALAMEVTARTYRYLDPGEVQAQKKAGGAK
ncbi:type IV pilus inner membrane component PilO [Verminephrobacter aporrectodeae]|uniref:type 4a pilus biogenesis protein PilO n=1 Tax=Verminephrobacter aporrectodeae TaxID=1110389 RepID=UPI0022384EC6|nr:type 4a pilus biogenesis protein PilO [Verminephrobacter aporrectodeae]MCW5256943.1 pilus assembly protein PilO [Verminephrobacter aporrectodeae subsp. tuberculatae]MCW8163426.1 pilus assembly protein PilO [Verminephrobacter aporrectodeae subsp. tuberculatae]MCW8167655.1 pilus assembly protein PilO [Verminephrobacter aporrectodeae subsp. tuberculatae]MCW8173978.1 pilus assembly protein PilO [Verminephrobacter aporrectodeae subsp. tuberculatae]MCW8202023.1 pilus assembly protein PilO [Vermin